MLIEYDQLFGIMALLRIRITASFHLPIASTVATSPNPPPDIAMP